MSEDKPKSVEVKALENEIADLKEKIEELSALPELLATEKHLREDAEKSLKKLDEQLMKIKGWGADFAKFPDSEFKGSFLANEILKILKEKE